MSHTPSQRSYKIKCMNKYRDRYIQQAKQLAKEKQLTIYYRQTVKIAYQIKFRKLICEITNSKGEILGGSTKYRFSTKDDLYLEAMIFTFAADESQAREIYNQEQFRNRNEDN